MQPYLDFEKPLIELETKIRELKQYSTGDISFSAEIEKLEKKAGRLHKEIFTKLSRWQRTQLARVPGRPFTLEYLKIIFTDWFEVHGDRVFSRRPCYCLRLRPT